MTLSKLLQGVLVRKMFQSASGQMVVTQDIKINTIQYDSRKIGPGDMFIAIRGTEVDGHSFIVEAVNRGAKVIVVQDDRAVPDSFFMHTGVVKVVVPKTREAMARISANCYGHPSEKLRLVGVTGTNGKTTTTYLLKSVLGDAGLIGTIEYHLGRSVVPATHTTPESLELNALLAQMIENGCTSAVMEASSHALDQHRVDGLRFAGAVFTNLTQDHLDYHGTMESYFAVKKMLFDTLPSNSTAVTNADDGYGLRIVQSSKARVLTYAVSTTADFRAENVTLSAEGTRFEIVHGGERTPVVSELIGRFNVYNILAAFAAGVGLGISKVQLQQRIGELRSVPGRFERIRSKRGWTAIIDYAHTPDALEKCLSAIHDLFASNRGQGRIITVFGCGGDRDRTKRPIMGRIASERSDVTIVTSDNPRSEDPEAVIDEVVKGARAGARVSRQADRKKAILKAVQEARSGDVVLIAGKGHEADQIVGSEKIRFSDREVVDELIADGN